MQPSLEKILPHVQKPARYVGGEWGSITKDRQAVDLRFAFCFPDVYEVGMSHLGSRILYGLLNEQDGIWCERVFAPWVDMEKEMRAAGIPLYGLESGDPLSEFDILGFTLQYELSFTNILNMLDLGGISPLASERTGLKNLVVAGGPCAYNPEPLCDFIDLFMIGDGEEVMLDLTGLYRQAKREGWSKHEFLVRAAQIEGIYVPSLYEVTYHEDGTVAAITPTEGAPAMVQKRIVADLDSMYYPENFVVPSTDIVFDRAMVELFRGCPRGCRFCQAGHTYRPLRTKSPETLQRQAEAVLKNSGYEEISLSSSLSTSDYGCLSELTGSMLDFCEPRHISLSLPSLRADSFNAELMERVQKVRKSGLTFAPEAGSKRLRDVINKNLEEDDLLNACEIAFRGGWNNIKLYFMIGLPTETSEDLDGIAEICKKVAYCWRMNTTNRGRGVKVTASASCFVPKPQTPFQWDAQNTLEMLAGKQDYMKKIMKTKNVTYNWHDAETSVLEGAIARGDRRQGKVLYTAWRNGCVFDGWDSLFSLEKWNDAFAACGLDPLWYAARQRSLDELFPWDHIGCGTNKEHLKREWLKSREAVPTPDCMTKCAGCGANALLKGGSAVFKARMKFAKEGRARYISHLDLMHTMQRAMARCEMPLWFTEGFNQHAYVSVALPLSTGFSGEWELLDFNLLSESVPVNAVEALNDVFPEGLRAIEIYPLADGGMPIRDIAWSKYRVTWGFPEGVPNGLTAAVKELFSRETVEILKRSKRGEKLVNMKELMGTLEIAETEKAVILTVVTAAGNNMSPEYLTKAMNQYYPEFDLSDAAYHRLCVYNEQMQEFR